MLRHMIQITRLWEKPASGRHVGGYGPGFSGSDQQRVPGQIETRVMGQLQSIQATGHLDIREQDVDIRRMGFQNAKGLAAVIGLHDNKPGIYQYTDGYLADQRFIFNDHDAIFCVDPWPGHHFICSRIKKPEEEIMDR